MNMWARWGVDAAAALPAVGVAGVYMRLGWCVVLALLGACMVRLLWRAAWGNSLRWRRGVAVLCAIWAWVPGVWGASFWLGLAFQSPSLTSVGLSSWALWRLLVPHPMGGAQESSSGRWSASVAGVLLVLGWLLLLDSFALLPVALYSLGFGPMPVWGMALLVAVPWAWCGSRVRLGAAWPISVGVCLVYVVLRLPSGNAWDALLDPWCWIVLHAVAVRWGWLRLRRA